MLEHSVHPDRVKAVRFSLCDAGSVHNSAYYSKQQIVPVRKCLGSQDLAIVSEANRITATGKGRNRSLAPMINDRGSDRTPYQP